MAEDEARFGLISWHKRCYCPLGQRPPCLQQRIYEWTWFYAALEPLTGESFCLYLPHLPRLDGDCYQLFLNHLARAYPDDLIILIRDNAPAHINSELVVPANIRHVALPPYSPELNPVERFFLEFRRALANCTFDTIDALHQAISEVLDLFTTDQERLELLTNFPWWWFGVTSLYDILAVSWYE